MSAGPLEPPLSLYVHLPWCVRKCPYCDFNSHKAGASPPKQRYVEALVRDIRDEAGRAGNRPLVSVFLGGGTPSLFSPAEIACVLDTVMDRFRVAEDVEITMEANPGTVDCGDPQGYRAAGINRLSIGAQSFDPASLETLGRIHSVADIGRAVDAAHAAGFDNMNLDIMYGLPGQNIEGALHDLEQAIALQTSHLSWYQLTLEPNTVFHARPPDGLPDDELCYAMQEAGQAFLADSGLRQYEVSAWAVPGFECRHNLNYWMFGDYLAVGAGAHGKLSRGGDIWRYAKPANPLGYMEAIETGAAGEGLVGLDGPNRVFEFMLNALRVRAGFTTRLFEERTGLDAAVLVESLARLKQKGLIEDVEPGSWRATGLGRRFLNDVQAEFLA